MRVPVGVSRTVAPSPHTSYLFAHPATIKRFLPAGRARMCLAGYPGGVRASASRAAVWSRKAALVSPSSNETDSSATIAPAPARCRARTFGRSRASRACACHTSPGRVGRSGVTEVSQRALVIYRAHGYSFIEVGPFG